MSVLGFFDRRIRGFRVVELGAAAVLLVLVMLVYLAKTGANGKREDIARTLDEIVAEQTQIRLLNAELAHEERPDRLETLSTQYLGLQPVDPRHDLSLQDLPQIGALMAAARANATPASTPKPASAATPAPASAPASVSNDPEAR